MQYNKLPKNRIFKAPTEKAIKLPSLKKLGAGIKGAVEGFKSGMSQEGKERTGHKYIKREKTPKGWRYWYKTPEGKMYSRSSSETKDKTKKFPKEKPTKVPKEKPIKAPKEISIKEAKEQFPEEKAPEQIKRQPIAGGDMDDMRKIYSRLDEIEKIANTKLKNHPDRDSFLKDVYDLRKDMEEAFGKENLISEKTKMQLEKEEMRRSAHKKKYKQYKEREQKEKEIERAEKQFGEKTFPEEKIKEYELPKPNKLSSLSKKEVAKDSYNKTLEDSAKQINDLLKDAKLKSKVNNIIKGPAVIRFEIPVAKGDRIGRVLGPAFERDIEFITGKKAKSRAHPTKDNTAIIEIPRDNPDMISFKDIISDKTFDEAKGEVKAALGKDSIGNTVVTDLTAAPHMLITGSTGSGKSVAVNNIINNILSKYKPNEAQLVLIDPKKGAEFNKYKNVPHLSGDVVISPEGGVGAMKAVVDEMNDRYKKISDAGVKKIEDYNKLEGIKKLPQKFVVIDEFAELKQLAGKDFMNMVKEIGQMGRAAGIHFVLATQFGSADILSNNLLNNVPTRLMMSMPPDAIASNAALRKLGVDKLSRAGDSIFSGITNQGKKEVKRLQGAFISDKDIDNIVNQTKSQGL